MEMLCQRDSDSVGAKIAGVLIVWKGVFFFGVQQHGASHDVYEDALESHESGPSSPHVDPETII